MILNKMAQIDLHLLTRQYLHSSEKLIMRKIYKNSVDVEMVTIIGNRKRVKVMLATLQKHR